MLMQAIWIFAALLVGYGIILLLMYSAQARLIYFPASSIAYTPEDIGLEYEPVNFGTADGVQLHGWFVPNDRARGTILFQHGNAGNISGRLETIRLLHGLEMNVFIYDYRGYGISDGSPSEQGTYQDALAAWNYLSEEKNIAADRIIVMGRSLGGAIAAWLTGRVRPAGLILESTFTSVPDLGAEVYPIFPVRWLARFEYDTEKMVQDIGVPLLIAHSPEDDLIPFTHGQRLFRSANEPKTFLEMEGGHNDGFFETGRRYRETLNQFISEVLEKERGTESGDGNGNSGQE